MPYWIAVTVSQPWRHATATAPWLVPDGAQAAPAVALIDDTGRIVAYVIAAA